MTLPRRARILLRCALAALLAALAPANALAAPPQLWLPTPPGETWRVLQGFQCGSHDGHQARSLDLVSADGRTAGAPVRAAADGTTFVWQRSTGTLILAHGEGFYTMYTHMRRVITTGAGLFVRRGTAIGEVGSVGTDVAHLHFTFFQAPDVGAYRRTSLELDFADGYAFHDAGGCNQHRSAIVVAAPNAPDGVPPTVSFGEASPNSWYCEDRRIEFGVSDNVGVGGFSQSFDQPPAADAPIFGNGASAGFVQLGWAGEGQHTLFVRAWDVSGEQATVALGPVGLDTTAPRLAPAAEPERSVPARTALSLSWNAADDGDGSGVAGYKLYLGADPNGTSDWFSDKPSVEAGGLEPGRYALRAQALDRGCKRSEWVTLQTIVVQ
jgi:hypothetical protein